MNLIQSEFYSDLLHTPVSVRVLLPKRKKTPFDPPEYRPKAVFPTLYLLHGAMDGGSSWLYNTHLAQLVDTYEIAAVIPEVGNSFYQDEPEGLPMFTYVTQELPAYLGSILPLSKKREETFVGGLSMGGYGSLYAAFRKPEQYGKVFSLSGALNIRRTAGFVSQCEASLPSHLRGRRDLPGSEYDVFALLEQVKPDGLPEIYLTCGTEDFFIRDNRLMSEAMTKRGIAHRYEPTSGEHDWLFWDAALTRAFAFLAGEETAPERV